MKKYLLLTTTVLACLLISFSSFAGEWKQNDVGYWYQNDDGSYPTNSWLDIDGKQYYFDADGYMLSNTSTPDGYTVGSDGAWIETKAQSTSKTTETTDVVKPVFSSYMSDRAEANTTKITALVENEGDSDLIIYSLGISIENDLYPKNNRKGSLSFSTDKGHNWTSVDSITLKPGEEYYLGFDIIGEPIVYGISTNVIFCLEYKGVGFMADVSPSYDSREHHPYSFLELIPDGSLTLDIFK